MGDPNCPLNWSPTPLALSALVDLPHSEAVDFCFRLLLQTAMGNSQLYLTLLHHIISNANLTSATYRADAAAQRLHESFFDGFFPFLVRCYQSNTPLVRDVDPNLPVNFLM